MAETLFARLTFLVVIILCSMLGVAFPFYTIKRFGEQVMMADWFVMIQCFAVGLVCGVALLHVLADAQEDLEKVSDFPVANAVCLLGCFLMVGLNRITILLVASRKHEKAEMSFGLSLTRGSSGSPLMGDTPLSPARSSPSVVSVHHGHVHQHLLMDPSLAIDRKARYKAYLLELAIAVHSVLVGLGLGIITKSSGAVITLGLALSFHQLFEGVALGMVGANAGLRGHGVMVMIFMFVASCPMGIVIGIYLESALDKEAAITSWILGSLNALAAGTLLEIGCVELMPEAFGHNDDNTGNKGGNEGQLSYGKEFARLLCLSAGGGVMVFLAIWA